MNNQKPFRPTFQKVQKDLAGFSDNIVMYVYHHLNGREEEAQSYLEEYKQEQEGYANELKAQLEEVKEEINLLQSQQEMRGDN